jgi:hypothetical protein
MTEQDNVVQVVATMESWAAGVAATRVSGAAAIVVGAGVAYGWSGWGESRRLYCCW